jgi:uncharacterized iron-regulated membrane protein
MPNYRILNRRLHRWGAIAVALPFLIIITSGLLLQLKKQLDFVQPPEQKGTEIGVATALTLPEILARVQTVPEAGIRTWADIDRVDFRPSKNMLKVVSMTRWEVQLDLATANILQVAYRRSDLIESIHDGSWFHPIAKLGVFLPAGAIVLGLWITGVYLWLLPYWTKRRLAAIRAAQAEAKALGASTRKDSATTAA